MTDKIHVYLMPGMAANPSIFENIKLPSDQFEQHNLEWILPESIDESIQDYAKRMILCIKHDNPVLIGVSFGGILVQEMSRLLSVRRLIVISSIKTKHELPTHLKWLRSTKAYKILPTGLVSNIDVLAKLTLGNTIDKRIELYQKYLSVNDKRYLDWAIKNVVCWDQELAHPEAIYIHGDKDIVFPKSCNENTIVVKGGTHIMVIDRYKWFNENLPKLILTD